MRRVRMAAAAVAGFAVLAGCSNGETANETLPSASTSAAQTSESLPPLGPPDLPMPDEAREQTTAGAEAFLRYYMDVYSWSQTHMDATYMDQFSQGCTLCDTLIKNLTDDGSADYTYDGGLASVRSSSFAEPKAAQIEGAFSIEQAALTVRSADGAVLTELSAPASTLDCGAILSWSSDDASWIFKQWDVN